MSPADLVSVAALPAVPVAEKVTAVSAPVEALNVFGPAVVPRIHDPTVAIPEPSVCTDAPVTEPPPPATANVTVTPAAGDPFSSLTITEGDGETAVPATPVSDVLEFAAMVAGADGVTLLSPPHAMHVSNPMIVIDFT